MLAILLTGILLLLVVKPGGGFIITVDAHDTDCFYDKASVNDKVTITFEVMEGGFKDIAVTITGPNYDSLHKSEKETSGSFTFSAMREGQYELCFDNQFSTMTPKVVMFKFHVARALEYYVDPSKRKDDVIEQAKAQAMINELSAKLGAVKMEQEYMHFRYRGHLDISDSVQFRILAWSIFGPTLLLIMTVLEIIYMKRFFEVKRVV
ncbi:transmembrane emp24 domain-containing protein 2 [Drosophila bipectinata]|uniref:transmembrane emp24 domain-containing protein 2 n=1 Tax=Drosophila bipectinata TaxID=42026 RepID=UPI001C8AC099|nr:transmembrane emp24 domain-containing protein 2 [Drosophila bipectinata]